MRELAKIFGVYFSVKNLALHYVFWLGISTYTFILWSV